MESNKIGSWLQLIANFGLLVGIVLVGIQINQSNAIAGASAGSVYFQQSAMYIGFSGYTIYEKAMQVFFA